MRVLFLSTYELGHQPLQLASLAAVAGAAGHDVRAVDLSVDELSAAGAAWADAVVLSVPMHTALLLALQVLGRIRSERPGLRAALCGLYAPVAAGNPLLSRDDLLAAGAPARALLEWLEAVAALRDGAREPVVDLGPLRPLPGPLPLRNLLPPLQRYARLVNGTAAPGDGRVVASTATTFGCNHRCRHCPVASVFRGRSRIVNHEAVMADIEQLVAAGAEHISFADPDFLNRPAHALSIARSLHGRWPELSFDATVKVEHVLRHRAGCRELSALGLVFVVSAFESRDDRVLSLLHKGHTALDELDALAVLRGFGLELRPSWLPFTPWTTLESVAEILTFTAEQDLVWSTDAVQLSIRLLLPQGSLLLEDPDPELRASLGSLDAATGSVAWRSADPSLDELQSRLAEAAERAGAEALSPDDAFGLIWSIARDAGAPLGRNVPVPVTAAPLPGSKRPRLTESWFCCAEPTAAQLVAVGGRPTQT